MNFLQFSNILTSCAPPDLPTSYSPLYLEHSSSNTTSSPLPNFYEFRIEFGCYLLSKAFPGSLVHWLLPTLSMCAFLFRAIRIFTSLSPQLEGKLSQGRNHIFLLPPYLRTVSEYIILAEVTKKGRARKSEEFVFFLT